MSESIKIYTDGACSGNPGAGAFSFIILNDENELLKKFVCGFKKTTNNRMELMAVIKSLQCIKTLKKTKDITIFSDSTYVVNAINEGWLNNWVRCNFKNKKNADLWNLYIKTASDIVFKIEWVKGHSDNKFNEMCDKMATDYIKKGELLTDDGYV